MTPKVCVTGAGGFLGSILTGELLRNGYEVYAVDRLNYGDSGVKPHLDSPNYHFYEHDIRDLYHIRKLVNEADYLVHLAALVGESLCDKYPDEMWDVNFEATKALVEVANENLTHMVYSSTCSNYGVTDGVATEESTLNPKGLYAESKVEAEKAVSRSSNYTILRFATLFGVSPRMRLDLMLNEWTRDMVMDGEIKIYQPSAYRPIFNVRDAANVIRTIIDRSNDLEDGVYNVGVNNYNFTKRQIAEIIQRELGGKISLVERGDPRSYRVSYNKINDFMRINPVSPETGVHLVKHYLENTQDISRCNNLEGYVDTVI